MYTHIHIKLKLNPSIFSNNEIKFEPMRFVSFLHHRLFFPSVVPPMIMGATDVLKEIGGVVNTTVVLHCNATGHPAPVISWLRDGQPLHTDLQHHISEDGTQLQVGTSSLERPPGRRQIKLPCCLAVK